MAGVLFCPKAQAQAPNCRWASQQPGGGPVDQAFGVATDRAGNVYVAGSFNFQQIYVGPPSLTGEDPAASPFLSKYNRFGKLLWTKRAGESEIALGCACAVDSQGNVFFAGSFSSSRLSLGGTVLTNAGSINIFLAKFNPDGDLLWARQAGGSDGSDQASSVAVDGSGNALVCGQLGSTNAIFGNYVLANSQAISNSNDSFVAKYDGAGNVVWARAIAQATGGRLAADSAGNSYLIGSLVAVADFGGGMVITNSGPNGILHTFIAKYSPSGDATWARQAIAGNPGSYLPIADFPTGIAVDPKGNSFITGSFFGTNAVFDNTTLTNHGEFDPFVAKYNQAGELLWVRAAGGHDWDFGTSVATDAAGNCYAAGWYESPVLRFGGISLTNSIASDSAYITKYDPVGNILWAKSSSEPFQGIVHVNAITSDPLGNLYPVGLFNSTTVIFDEIVVSNLGTGGISKAFVAKIEGPQLSLKPSGNQSQLSWPTNAVGLHLESANAIAGPWSAVTNAPSPSSNQNRMTLETTNGSCFFRLNGP